MHFKKMMPLLILLSVFTTTSCSNKNIEKPVKIRNCFIGEKMTNNRGNSFQINNVFINDSGLYLQGDFTFKNYFYFDSIAGSIDDSEKEKSILTTINVERSSAENNIEFKTKSLSCSGSYVLAFDVETMKIGNIENIHINFHITEDGCNETYFVIFAKDISVK
ncbi:MAG: hypothetical protein RSB95_02260 [Bacilli bacterium]